MGEMADYVLEGLSDIEYDAHGRPYDGFDNVMYEEETDSYIGSGHPRPQVCRYCGAAGLYWGEHETGWRLFRGSQLHSCPQYRRI